MHAYFRLSAPHGDRSLGEVDLVQPVDEYELLVLMVRMQDLPTVRRIVELDRFGGDINRVLDDGDSVGYCPRGLPYDDASTEEDMEEFLREHGARMMSGSVNYCALGIL